MTHTVTQSIGAATVSVITDGAVTFEHGTFPDTSPDHLNAVLQASGQPEIRTNFNATLIRTGGHMVLVDAGPRDLFGPTCGHLPAGLAELGVTPDQVDTLVATHLHPDHVAGMITPAGAAVFAKATLHVAQAEVDFWSNPAHFAGDLARMAGWAELARAVLAAYADRLVITSTDADVAPGLSLFPLPGHTPGHSGWRLDSDGVQLVHVGDIIHAPALQLADPAIATAFDIDGDMARATRNRLLDELATDGALFTGGHFLQPAFLRVVRDGTSYRLAN
jgi:glyoxylase-like metal-dependent hydrolase (beta-lactamase superfamily II)